MSSLSSGFARSRRISRLFRGGAIYRRRGPKTEAELNRACDDCLQTTAVCATGILIVFTVIALTFF